MKSLLSRMIQSFLSLAFVIALLACTAGIALAADAPKPKQTKRTNVDFEDQLIQGEVKKPELFYLLQKKQFNFGKLIKLRENFVPEMGKTAEDVEKTR